MQSRRLLVVALMTAASTVQGQRPGREGPPMMGPPMGAGLATLLIDARRELNLTPRQLVALDSLERAEFTQRKDGMDRMRARHDSLCANRHPCELTRDERMQLMGGPAGIEGRMGDRLRTDSLRRTRIMGMLDTTQRRLASRVERRERSERFGRMERRIDGPPRRTMRDDGPRGRGFGGHDRFQGWDGPRGFDDARHRMRRDGWRDDRDDFNDDDRMGPGRGRDDRRGPPPRRRMREDEPTPPDTLSEQLSTPADTLHQKLPERLP